MCMFPCEYVHVCTCKVRYADDKSEFNQVPNFPFRARGLFEILKNLPKIRTLKTQIPLVTFWHCYPNIQACAHTRCLAQRESY